MCPASPDASPSGGLPAHPGAEGSGQAVRISRSGWILSPAGDTFAFLGPVLAGLALVAWASARGTLYDPVSPLLFFVLVACVDVGHVYATAFRVYLDPTELRRRPGLYLGLPLLAYGAGVMLHSHGPLVFWRALAYLAVYHFVRQQWGWLAIARRKAGEAGALDFQLDRATIYACTLYPLLHWHTHLPAPFEWFLAGDFAALPGWLDPIGLALHVSILGLFALRQIQRLVTGSGINWAKVQVVVATWVAWFVPIVWLRSDLAFTTLNVLAHGVPYLAFVWHLEHTRHAAAEGSPDSDPASRLAWLFAPRLILVFLALLALAGVAEEWLWDRAVWHENGAVFPGPEWFPSAAWLGFLVPLLALPQATHYLLDGWIWRSSHRR